MRLLHELPFDGIPVHVLELLVFLLLGEDVEIVEAALPETAQPAGVLGLAPQKQLPRAAAVGPATPSAGDPLLEDLHDGRGRAEGWLAD